MFKHHPYSQAFALLLSTLCWLGCETLPATTDDPDAGAIDSEDPASKPEDPVGDPDETDAGEPPDAPERPEPEDLDGGPRPPKPDAAVVEPGKTCAELTCDPHAECVEAGEGDASAMQAGARCVCDEGYAGDGLTCMRDECVTLEGEVPACDEHASSCEDPSGEPDDVICGACEPGYQGDGTACFPNECTVPEDGPTPCGEHTVCSDPADGALDNYTCACSAGYARCGDAPGPFDACETHLLSDPQHCGRCGLACAGGLTCNAGTCEQSAWRLVAGAYGFCAMTGTPDGDGASPVMCWGSNSAKQISPGAAATINAPTQLLGTDGPDKVFDVALSSLHSCYISAIDGIVRCQGGAGDMLGVAVSGADGSVTHEVEVPGAVELAAGGNHSCARTAIGEVWCWGSLSLLGTGSTDSGGTNYRSQVPTIRDAVQIRAGNNTTCVRRRSGFVSCWSEGERPWTLSNANGAPLGQVTQLAVGPGSLRRFGCAVTADKTLHCWGAYPGLTVEADIRPQRATPIDIDGESIVDVAAGEFYACAVTETGKVFCFGWNLDGAVNPAASRDGDVFLPPQEVPGLEGVIDIEGGALATCARMASGQVRCWGANTHGELGDTTTVARFCPRNVTGLADGVDTQPTCPL